MSEPEDPPPEKSPAQREPSGNNETKTPSKSNTGIVLKFRDEANEKHSLVAPTLEHVLRLGIANALGELPAFTCSRCGKVSLDPCGWDGPGKPLCDKCADGDVL
jgi:hypothetical protein